MSDPITPAESGTTLMTAPVNDEVAGQFREIAKANSIPLRVLGGMLYERFVDEYSSGLIQLAPVTIIPADSPTHNTSEPAAPTHREPILDRVR
jgi:hypothetical protein